MKVSHIRLQEVRFLLSSRQYSEPGVWLAMSDHVEAGSCGDMRNSRADRDARGQGPCRLKPGLSTNHRGYTINLVKRVRTLHGLKEVKRTWGIGFKALLAELQPKRSEGTA